MLTRMVTIIYRSSMDSSNKDICGCVDFDLADRVIASHPELINIDSR